MPASSDPLRPTAARVARVPAAVQAQPVSTPGAAATMIEVLRLLRPYWGWLAFSAAAGLLAGVGTVALLAQINRLLHAADGSSDSVVGVLAGLCALVLVGRAVSLIGSNWVGQRLVAKVRQSLARRILMAPIDALERYRSHRLLPVLINDVDTVSSMVFALSALAIAAVVSAGCLLYLAWLSLPMFGLLVLALLVGTLIQQLAQRRSARWYQQARKSEERLHKAYRRLGEGAKELRMNRARRQQLLDIEITQTIDDIDRVNRRATNTFVLASAFGAALYFLLIAGLLAGADVARVGTGVLGSFVLVLLYLKGPMDQIASILPALGRTRVALQRIADLTARFDVPELSSTTPDAERIPQLSRAIELRGVRYTYRPADDGDEDALSTDDDAEHAGADAAGPFEVGPIDLRIDRGSIVFVVGDNGSGKTTMVKLLLGLYAPDRGEVLLDGVPVTAHTRDDYRQLFGTVFADFHLFEELCAAADGGVSSAGPRDLQAYLERLQIADKVGVRDGAFTTLDLSTGQRKRLALAHAYVEGRGVLVFDEWAADQDPAFRRLFYRELLPELRALGHTLIVISHDERYFDVADQVVRISRGRIVGEPAAEVDEAAAPMRLAA